MRHLKDYLNCRLVLVPEESDVDPDGYIHLDLSAIPEWQWDELSETLISCMDESFKQPGAREQMLSSYYEKQKRLAEEAKRH